MVPIVSLEFVRDCLLLRGHIPTIVPHPYSSLLIDSVDIVHNVTLRAIFSQASLNQVFAFNHLIFFVSAVQLCIEKFYILFVRVPRPKLRGAIGHHFQRWIDWHWITIGAGIAAKYIAEHKPEKNLLSASSSSVHFYASVFLFAELIIGVVIKGYMVWSRNSIQNRRRSAQKQD